MPSSDDYGEVEFASEEQLAAHRRWRDFDAAVKAPPKLLVDRRELRLDASRRWEGTAGIDRGAMRHAPQLKRCLYCGSGDAHKLCKGCFPNYRARFCSRTCQKKAWRGVHTGDICPRWDLTSAFLLAHGFKVRMLRREVFEVEKVKRKGKKGDAEWEECWTCRAAACTKDECDRAACDYIMRLVMGGIAMRYNADGSAADTADTALRTVASGNRFRMERKKGDALVEVEEEEEDILDLLPQHQKQLLRQREEEKEKQEVKNAQRKEKKTAQAEGQPTTEGTQSSLRLHLVGAAADLAGALQGIMQHNTGCLQRTNTTCTCNKHADLVRAKPEQIPPPLKPLSPKGTRSDPIVIDKAKSWFKGAFTWDLGSQLSNIEQVGRWKQKEENIQHQDIPDISSYTVMEWLKQYDKQRYDDVMDWREEWQKMQGAKARSYAHELAGMIMRRADEEERDYVNLNGPGDYRYRAMRHAKGKEAARNFKAILDEASKHTMEEMLRILKGHVRTGVRNFKVFDQEVQTGKEYQQQLLALCHNAAEEALSNGFACIHVSRGLREQASDPPRITFDMGQGSPGGRLHDHKPTVKAKKAQRQQRKVGRDCI